MKRFKGGMTVTVVYVNIEFRGSLSLCGTISSCAVKTCKTN